MRLMSRLTGRRKAFTQPPFWSQLDSRWSSSWTPDKESIENDFEGYVRDAYKSNGVVFACSLTRQWIFSEARFQWRKKPRNGRPGPLFGNEELALLENPWPGGTTGELLAKMESHATLGGNSYTTTADDNGRVGRAATGSGRRLAQLRPDWVTIILGSRSGSPYAVDAQPIAYLYKPPPYEGQQEETILLPSEVAHYSPIPDPEARFRGMSWLTPVVREIMADKAASKHRLKFFEHGATLSTVVRLDKDLDPVAFDEFVDKFKAQHEGVDTAYKTLFLGGGADLTLVGADMQQVDFKATQGAGETRIAAASRVHPVIVGLSEGLQGSSLNAGNFNAARRLVADTTMRPLWRMAAASLQKLVKAPAPDVELWYDDRDIAFLRDDASDVAKTQSLQAAGARQWIDAGFDGKSVVDFLQTGDLSRLKHTGRPTVQLQAGTAPEATADDELPTDEPAEEA